jgi:hypothetical protein
MVVGGALLALLVLSCGMAAIVAVVYFMGRDPAARSLDGPLAEMLGTTDPLLAGRWEITEKGKRCSLEFTKDGKLHVSGDTGLLREFRFMHKVLSDFNMQPARGSITYRPVAAKELEIQGDYTALLDKLGAGGKGDVSPEKVRELRAEFRPKERVRYAVTETELALTGSEGKTIKLKRLE